MKSALTRLGVRGFKPHLRKAPERLAGLRTAEDAGLPPNSMDELRRDMERLALVREQINSIEKTRAERLELAPDSGPHAMVRLLSRVIGIGIETADMLVREVLSRKLRDRRAVARYAGQFCCRCSQPLVCRFSDAGTDNPITRSGGRRPKSAKARSRGVLGTGWKLALTMAARQRRGDLGWLFVLYGGTT